MVDPKEALASLTDKVRIGPFDFKLVQESVLTAAAKQRWGECSTMEQTIRIQSEFPSSLKAADTLLHEILHGIFWAYGILDEDKEERLASTISTALVALHRDNPWLAPWLIAAC